MGARKRIEAFSEVVQFLNSVWENANKSTGHSWERLNHAMRRALELAIGSGFPFATGDFKHVATHYRSGCWLGESMEWCYSLAVAVGNRSAVIGYELFKDRPPFIADRVDPGQYADRGFNHLTGPRVRERLAEGFSFPWLGETVKVTSFARDGQSLVACAYRGQDGGKIKKRFTITRADILQSRKGCKRREVLEALETKE